MFLKFSKENLFKTQILNWHCRKSHWLEHLQFSCCNWCFCLSTLRGIQVLHKVESHKSRYRLSSSNCSPHTLQISFQECKVRNARKQMAIVQHPILQHLNLSGLTSPKSFKERDIDTIYHKVKAKFFWKQKEKTSRILHFSLKICCFIYRAAYINQQSGLAEESEAWCLQL